MLDVRVGLRNVLALDEHAPVGAGDGRVEHVRDPQPRLGVQGSLPELLEHLARGVVAHGAIPGQLVRERAHVAGALHVVLPTHRVDAHTLAANVPGGHRQVRHTHDHGRALTVLRDPQAVVDRRVGCGCVQPCRGPHLGSGDAGDLLHRLRTVLRAGDEPLPLGEGVHLAALFDEGPVDESLSDDHVPEGVDDGDVRTGVQLKVVGRLDVRAAHQVDATRVDDDQRGTLAQSLLHPGGEDRVPIGRVGTYQQDHVGLLDRSELLRARRGAEGLLQPIPRRGVAHPGAGVDVVVAEPRPDHLLHHKDLFVSAT
ncbi:hypothetical protein GALL_293510 [mine drainage metagenome]|uniref:Uncharacterized protein n=1 Tax=mine drainage metagenome TaxID=410659 RepID=A0A1J5QZR9_9ZZZZ